MDLVTSGPLIVVFDRRKPSKGATLVFFFLLVLGLNCSAQLADAFPASCIGCLDAAAKVDAASRRGRPYNDQLIECEVSEYRSVGERSQNVGSRIYNVQSAQEPWSIRQSTLREGLYRFEARQGDFWAGDARRDRIRTELQSVVKERYGADTWVSFAVMLSARPSLLSSSMVIGQFHATEDVGDFSGYPVVELNLHSDGLHVYTASNSAVHSPSAYPRIERVGGVSFNLGRWNYVVMRVRFSYLGTGALQVWLNGEEIVDVTNASIGMNDAIGPYWKYGLYWRPETVEQTVVSYVDNVEVGAANLSQRIKSPLPVLTWGAGCR